LSDIALRLHLAKRHEACAEIVQRRLIPLLQSIPSEDLGLRHRLIVQAMPALRAGASATAGAILATLPSNTRDDALWEACWFVLRQVPSREPYERPARLGYDITLEDANVLASLVGEMETDNEIYAIIRVIVESVGGARRDRLKRGQRADLARTLQAIASEKFPNARFIRHRGWGILADAQITRLADQDNSAVIRELTTEARTLPNVVDRAFVISSLATVTQSARDRLSLIEEARALADTVPMLADRVDLYEELSAAMENVDEKQSRSLLKDALELAFQGEGESLAERRRSVLNAACRRFPDVASSFASASDDDPAKKRVDHELRLQRLNDNLSKRRPPRQSPEVHDKFDWSRATWRNLGTLNAGRSGPVTIERAVSILEYASGQPLSRAYPIFAWFIANAIKLPQGAERARPLLLGLFEASLVGFDVSIMTGERPGGQAQSLIDFGLSTRGTSQGAQIYEDGERDLGLQDIRGWLQEVAPKRLWIVEPYFGIGSVAALALIRDLPEECSVTLLASREDSLKRVQPPEDGAYRAAWARLRSDEPPETTLIFAGTRDKGKFPVHDRWWLCEAGGLCLGTSYGGIGSRLSAIRRIDSHEAVEVMKSLEPYLMQTRREFEGERLLYRSFTL
jgi:hypothetical protein